MTCHYVTLTLLNLPFVAAFYLIFAGPGIGFGHVIAKELRKHETVLTETIIGTIALFVLMLLLDIIYWGTDKIESRFNKLLGYIKYFIYVVFLTGVTSSTLFLWDKYPSLPVALYILMCPVYIYAIKKFIMTNTELYVFMFDIGVALLITSVVTLIPWVVWVSTKYPYNEETKLKMSQEMDCDDIECQSGYILWISPLIATVTAFVFGWMSLILSKYLKGSDIGMILAKIFVTVIVLSIISVWVSASIAGKDIGIATAVNVLVITTIIIMGVIVTETIGWDVLQKKMLQIAIIKKVSKLMVSKWAKATFMVFLIPLFPIILLFSLIRHNIRKVWPFGVSLDDDCRHCALGKGTYRQIKSMQKWNWASIIPKMIWVVIIYLIIFVGVGRMVTIFMSWLNEKLVDFSLATVVFIFIGVGITMFLLPPVPGVPVYLAGGIIIVAKAETDFTYWGAIGFMIGIGFLLKMIAIVMQQKIFGELMGKSLSIRNMVGVNSTTVKTIRLVLQQPGLKINKVAILIGGPDWPTSVLTGILRLNVFDMLYGSLPVIFLIAPCVVAAAFFLREGDSWQTAGTVMLTLAGLVQFSAMIAAAYYLERYGEEHADEIAAIPDDEEVKQLEQSKLYGRYLKKMITHWHPKEFPASAHIKTEWQNYGLPIWVKFNLIMGVITACVSCYICLFGASYCFESFEITDTIDERLDGKAINVIKKPVGWIASFLFIACIVFLIIYYVWVSFTFKRFLRENHINVKIPPDGWDVTTDDDLESEDEDEDDKTICLHPISYKKSIKCHKTLPNGFKESYV